MTPRLIEKTGAIAIIVVSILCAWPRARFSPEPKARHVPAFMIPGEVFGIASTIPNWNSGWPH
jgi:hypothetical protein